MRPSDKSGDQQEKTRARHKGQPRNRILRTACGQGENDGQHQRPLHGEDGHRRQQQGKSHGQELGEHLLKSRSENQRQEGDHEA